jgi:hypothetical protein
MDRKVKELSSMISHVEKEIKHAQEQGASNRVLNRLKRELVGLHIRLASVAQARQWKSPAP